MTWFRQIHHGTRLHNGCSAGAGGRAPLPPGCPPGFRGQDLMTWGRLAWDRRRSDLAIRWAGRVGVGSIALVQLDVAAPGERTAEGVVGVAFGGVDDHTALAEA